MKHKCPRCNSTEGLTRGVDEWSPDDIVTYIQCLKCNLLFWFSKYYNEIRTNGRDAN